VRYAADHKQKTRARILRAAARLFRKRGIAATGVDSVMAAAGLTAGAFYAHFRSKDALVLEAFEAAADESYESWYGRFEHLRGRAWAQAMVALYLSEEHRDALGKSCVLPSLGADIARGKPAGRARFERRVRGMFDHITEQSAEELGVTRAEVIAGIALAVGGVLLARAVQSPALSEEILRAAREGAERLLGLAHPSAKRRSSRAHSGASPESQG
jgi:TetR/AcrR family transcriptional regulator, transcriptional repressor for nem operon